MKWRDKAKNVVLAARERVERALGRVLGDEDMPAREQIEELRGHLKTAGERALKSTGRALGDEDMPARQQAVELRGHLRMISMRVRQALHSGDGSPQR